MRLLVSVRDVAEAREALRAGVDFIDLKEPAAGALGGLALAVIREVVAALRAGDSAQDAARAQAPMISATIGDLAPDALEVILARVQAVGACGVDLVKVGVPGRGLAACTLLAALATLPLAIVPVLIADDGLDVAVIEAACAPAFAAVMADTQAKRAGSLLELLGVEVLAAFIDRAHTAGRMVGLAGALRLADLPQLARLGPDFAGFRSAVCDGSRAGRLDPGRLEALHAAIAIRGQARVHGPGARGRLEALRAAIAMTPTAAPVPIRPAAEVLAT